MALTLPSMDIVTDIWHLKEMPHYATEKPYTMRYEPELPLPANNVHREQYATTVEDMRGRENDYSLDSNGFVIAKVKTAMTYEDYDNHNRVVDGYLEDLRGVLESLFPESSIDFVSYFVRKRHAEFPYATGHSYNFGQPNIVAHIDATPGDLIRQIRVRYGEAAEEMLQKRNQYITIWKPLKGPLYDWPLALCDGHTVDVGADLEPQDIVDRHEVLENAHVYHRDYHKWYYLSGQTDDEALVFRQADTKVGGRGTPHCAIANTKAPADAIPRESIEVVAFVCG